MRLLTLICLAALPLLLASGCGKETTPKNANSPSTNASGPKTPTELALTEGTVEDIDRAVKDSEKAVVLVEFWALASEPSPELSLAANTRGGNQQVRGDSLAKDKVAWHGMRKAEHLAHKYEGYFLRVISVNVDGPGKKDEVLKHLTDHKARHVTNILLKDEPSKAKERFGFGGKAPYQIVFDRKGKKVWATGDPLPSTLDDLLFQELDK